MAVVVAVKGAREASASLRRMADGARAGGGVRTYVGSALAYAYGIETGRHRSGGLARAAGGAWMLTHALQALAPSIPGAVATALPRGPGAVVEAIHRVALAVESRAKAQTPVRTGALRRSIHVSGRVR